MWQKSLALVGWGLSLAACGAAPASPPQAPAVVVSAAPPAPPAPVVRAASADVTRYWVFDDTPQLALYSTLDSLLKSELFAGLVPGILEQTGDLLKSTQRDCLNVLAAQARALAVGADARGALSILELGPEGVKAARSACVGSMFPVDRISVAGADEAYAADKDVVVVEPGVVLIGSKAVVEAALAPGHKPGVFPPALTLKDDQQLIFQVKLPREGVAATGNVQLDAARFRFGADVDLPSDAVADMIEHRVTEGRAQMTGLAGNAAAAPAAKLLDAFKLERHGSSFNASLELKEPVADQARDLGVLAGLAVFGVRRYIVDAKTAEARIVIGSIAKAIAATLSEEAAPSTRRVPKKLVSLPAVPATVPRGVRYQSAPDDWKAWAPIHFALSEPQAYQYQVVASKDGKTAEITARGDLNGDSKTSLFRVKIVLDPKTSQLTATEHSEESPTE